MKSQYLLEYLFVFYFILCIKLFIISYGLFLLQYFLHYLMQNNMN